MSISVVTYVSLEAPSSQRWLALLFSGKSRLPMVFAAADEEAAAANARDWLAAELDRETRRRAVAEARRSPRKSREMLADMNAEG